MDKVEVNTRVISNYVTNYNFQVRGYNFRNHYTLSDPNTHDYVVDTVTEREIFTEVSELPEADILEINKAAADAYKKYVEALTEMVYPLMDKKLGRHTYTEDDK